MLAQAIAGGGGGSTVTLDGTVTHGQTTAGSPFNVAHTTGTLTNGLMLIGVTLGDSGNSPVINSVKWNTTETATLIATVQPNGDASGRVSLYKLVNPTAGSFNVTVAYTPLGAPTVTVGVATFDGVDQTTPVTGSGTTGSGSGTTSTTGAISSATGNMLLAVHGMGSSWSSTNNTQQYIENVNGNTACGNGAMNTAAGAASVTMTATGASDFWGVVGADIRHA